MERAAVIFDFDGVLVDSEPAHMRAILEAIEPEGWHADPGAMFDEFVGTSDRHCFRVLGERHGVEVGETKMEALIERKLDRFLAGVREGRVTAQPGAFELVRAAAERVPVAVCTGSRRNTVAPVLEAHGVMGVLVGLVAADDVTRTKPDPEAYATACELVGMAPDRCVAIEDTEHGIASGVAAGVRVLAVQHTWGADRLSRADRVYENISDITVDELLSGG